MKNKALAAASHPIPYIKDLRPVAGSVTAAILWQQLDYWFSKYPNGFFKFLEPLVDDQGIEKNGYRHGDSWTEELGYSPDEFRSAFDKIGIRYKSKKAHDEAMDGSGGQFVRKRKDGKDERVLFCSYHDKIRGMTYYFRNHELVDQTIDWLLCGGDPPCYVNGECPVTEMDIPKLRNSGSPSYVLTESTTETTTDSATPSASGNSGSNEPNVKGTNGTDWSFPSEDEDRDARKPGGTATPRKRRPPTSGRSAVSKAIQDDLVTRFQRGYREIYRHDHAGNGKVKGVVKKVLGDLAEPEQQRAVLDLFFKLDEINDDNARKFIEKSCHSVECFGTGIVQNALRRQVIPPMEIPREVVCTVVDATYGDEVEIGPNLETWINGEETNRYRHLVRDLQDHNNGHNPHQLFAEALGVVDDRVGGMQPRNVIRKALGLPEVGIKLPIQ